MTDETTLSDEQAEVSQFLTFTIGNELYGFPVEKICEVIESSAVTQVPLMSKIIHGVINLRGNVVTIIDLHYFLYGSFGLDGNKCIVVSELRDDEGEYRVGLLIDTVCDVVDIADEMIEHDTGFGTKISPEYVAGIGKNDNEFIILLNLERIADVNKLAEMTGS